MNSRNTFRPSDYVVAVQDCAEGSNSLKSGCMIRGTAFCIRKNTFMTAGHVIDVENQGTLSLIKSGLHPVPVKEIYHYPDIDVAILEADIESADPVKFSIEKLPHLAQVATNGFPYAYDNCFDKINLRSFKGDIVGICQFSRFLGSPWIYELSFNCDRGLSGAPLWEVKGASGPPVVHGVIIGNRATEMTVLREEEIEKDGKHTSTYEKIESMRLGVAVTSFQLSTITIPRTNTTLEKLLSSDGLLI